VFRGGRSKDLLDACKVKIKLRPTVSRPVLVSSTHLGPKTRFLLLSDSCGFVDVGRSLWQEDVSVVYNCCWSSPAQSFSGPSPAGLMTTFNCLRFEIPPTWRARSLYLNPPGTGWPSYTPRHWDPFSSPPTTRRATVEVFEPAYTRRGYMQVWITWYLKIQFVPHRKHITSPLQSLTR
jgi:hypothetical protein